VRTRRNRGPLSLLAIAMFSWASAAMGDRGGSPSYLSEYVYLHETRDQGIAIQIGAHTKMCRGRPDGARGRSG